MKPKPAHYTGLIAATAMFSVLCNLLMLTGPLFMLQVYDRVLASRSEETLVALFALVAGLYALYAVFEYARGRVMARVGAQVQSHNVARIFSDTLERAALNTPKAKASLADLDIVRSFASSPVFLAIFDLPWTPVFIAAIFVFHPVLGWVSVCGGALLLITAILNQALTATKHARGVSLNQSAHQFAQSAMDQSDVVWAQGMQDAALARYTHAQDAAVERLMRVSDWTGVFATFSKAFRLFLQSAILAVGAWLVLQQDLSAGAMIACSILMGRALAPVDMVIGQWAVVQKAKAAWSNVRMVLHQDENGPEPTPLPVPEAQLVARNATVISRQDGRAILDRVSFRVEPGTALGVIGRSGAGKSTLARLVVGLVEPVSGDVRLGGATLGQYGAKALGAHIGYLPQDVRFFHATIAENIAQMASEPDPQRVVAAAMKAGVHDIILSLPEGYDTVLETSTAQLSGGQKQRLALARALYNDPVLLILDEPNSALDAEGSDALNTTIAAMKTQGKSVLVMTHRPTAIQSCDMLLVLEAGKVSAFGPRDDVIKATLRNAERVTETVSQRRRA